MTLKETGRMQRVVFLTDRIFWPANDGHKVVLNNYCKSLAEEYGCEVHVLSFLEPGQSEIDLNNRPSYISSAVILDRPSRIGVVRNLLPILLRKGSEEPAQCALFKSTQAGRRLMNAVEKLQPSHVFFDLPRLSPFVEYIKNVPCKKVLYMEDVFSKRYVRQLNSISTLGKTGGVAGKYSSNISGAMGRISSLKALQKALLGFESKRMNRLEHSVVNTFDYVVLVSPGEAKDLAEDTNAQNVIAIPLGIDCSFYTAGSQVNPRQGILSFLGDMRSSANADSLRYIVNDVLPLVDANVVLEVSGTAPDELREEFIDNDQVRFLGRVEDTRETLRSSSVFIAPIAYGTGIKTKLLEAMAIGVPIVTNSIGNEGIGLIDGVDALVDDNKEAIAQDVVRLLNDRKLAQELVDSARAKVLSEFDWAKSLRTFSCLGFSRANKE